MPIDEADLKDIRLGWGEGLTRKQAKFLELYLASGSVKAAFRDAYPGKMSPATADRKARRMLKHPIIAAIVKAARTEAEEHTRRLVVQTAPAVNPLMTPFLESKQRIAQALATLAFTDARDYFEWGPNGVVLKDSKELTDAQAYGVISVSQTVSEKGGTIRVKLADKRQALMDLARLQGFLDAPSDGERPADDAKVEAARAKLYAALKDLAKPEPLTIVGDVAPKFED